MPPPLSATDQVKAPGRFALASCPWGAKARASPGSRETGEGAIPRLGVDPTWPEQPTNRNNETTVEATSPVVRMGRPNRRSEAAHARSEKLRARLLGCPAHPPTLSLRGTAAHTPSSGLFESSAAAASNVAMTERGELREEGCEAWCFSVLIHDCLCSSLALALGSHLTVVPLALQART